MADYIPVIDFSLYGLQVQDKNSVTVDDLQNLDNEIYSAFKDIGFCYLKNHGFSTELVKKVRKVTREFFEQPEDMKSQYARKVETNNGWVAVGRESLNPERPGDYKEAYNYSPSEMGQKSPEFLPDFLSLNKEFFTMAMRLTDRILDVLSIGLKLEQSKKIRYGVENIRTMAQSLCFFKMKLEDLRTAENTKGVFRSRRRFKDPGNCKIVGEDDKSSKIG